MTIYVPTITAYFVFATIMIHSKPFVYAFSLLPAHEHFQLQNKPKRIQRLKFKMDNFKMYLYPPL